MAAAGAAGVGLLLVKAPKSARAESGQEEVAVSTGGVAVISPLGYTGLAYYDYSLCQSLAEQGIDVDLYSSDRWILDSHQPFFRVIPKKVPQIERGLSPVIVKKRCGKG